MGSSASDPLYVDVTYIGKGGVGEEYVTVILCDVMWCDVVWCDVMLWSKVKLNLSLSGLWMNPR